DCWGALKRTQKSIRRFVSVIEPGPPERLDLASLAADALTLAAPRLRKQRVGVELRASKGHFVVGRRGELLRLLVHVLLNAAGMSPAPPAGSPRPPSTARRSGADEARPVLLWIDADDLLLEIMVQTLHEYDLRTARSAAEAMQLLVFDVKPALIFCNVRLPDR